MINYLIFSIFLFIAWLFGYNSHKIVKENEELNKKLESNKKVEEINNMSDTDIDKLFDKYE